MVRENIAKYIGYPIQDYVKKTDILTTLKFLRESQYWEEEKLEEYRLTKLKKLIDFAHKNVPYYSNLFDTLKFKSRDISSLNDLEKIPILTKEIVRKENMNLVARNVNMKYIKQGKTGGTTGSPIIVLKDRNNRSFTWASYYRWYEWMGISYYDREATFWGARTILSKSNKKFIVDNTTNYLQNNLSINAFNMRDRDLSEIYKKIKTFNPVIIKGYLSAILDLANFIENNSLEGLNPKVLSTTSETLLPHSRSFIEEKFNAPVFDQYGCGELSAISYECSKHNGLHINQEHIICEILNDNCYPVINKPGRIVATDLDNYVMPFIRYENGDIASFSSKKCTCGVNQPLMNSIEGRAIDTITLKNGSRVHGVFFTDILYEMNIHSDRIQRFQVYQDKPGIIEFRIETNSVINTEIKKTLHKNLLKFFILVEIKEVKQFSHDENGKFKYIINNIPHYENGI